MFAQQKCFLFLVMVFLVGCATTGGIEKNYAKINYADGINRNEAIAIAQRDLLDNEKAKHKYRVTGPYVEEKEMTTDVYGGKTDAWFVRFESKNFTGDMLNIFLPSIYWLYIEKKEGKIISRGEGFRPL